MDFTIKSYRKLLEILKQKGYSFYTFEEYCDGKASGKYIILRHDVDEMAQNALSLAKIEAKMGIRATYNFRIVKQSNQPEIIKQIVELGHELGYHYEDLAFSDGDYEKAIKTFKENLSYFRTFSSVRTVCMHGSSTSKHDNRSIWKKSNLKDEGLIGEPYLTIDFNQIFYLTDTGYCWDGSKVAVRDIVVSPFKQSYHLTKEIISAVELEEFPEKAMILAHTLWTNKISLWLFIFIRELLRNKVKKISRNNAFVRNIYAKFVKYYWKK